MIAESTFWKPNFEPQGEEISVERKREKEY